MSVARAAAPGGLSTQDFADLLDTPYRTAASLVSHAHNGRSKSGKLYRRQQGGYGLYFADESDAQAFDIGSYAATRYAVPKATRAPNQTRVYEYVASMPRGATQAQIRLSLGLDIESSTTLIAQMCKSGRLHSIGPVCWKRYFTDADLMESMREEVIAEIQRVRTERRETARELKNERKRALRASLPAKPPKERKPPKDRRQFMIEPRTKHKAAPAKRAAPVVELMAPARPDTAPVKIKRSKAHDCEPFIPPHVKVKYCEGYRGDVRFMVSAPVVGGFATMGIGRYMEQA